MVLSMNLQRRSKLFGNMGLTFIQTDKLIIPVILCDACGERLVHRDTKKAIKKCIKLILLDLDFLSNPDWREACAKIERRVGNKLVDFDRKW